MAYSRSWNETQPANSQAADTIAQELRALKVDIRERLASILGTGVFTDDPVEAIIINLAAATLAKIIAGSTGLAIRKADDSASLLSVDQNGDLTLLRKFLSGNFNSDLVVDSAHNVTFNSPVRLSGVQGTVDRHVSSTSAIDWATSNNQFYLTSSPTVLTFGNPITGGWYNLELKYGGAHAITFPASVKWAFGGTSPTTTGVAGLTDFFSFYWNGTNYAGFVVGLNCNV